MLSHAIKKGEVGRRDEMKAEEEEMQCKRGEYLIIISGMWRKVEPNVTVLLVCNDEDGASVGVKKRKTSLTYLNRLVVAQAQRPH